MPVVSDGSLFCLFFFNTQDDEIISFTESSVRGHKTLPGAPVILSPTETTITGLHVWIGFKDLKYFGEKQCCCFLPKKSDEVTGT
jgi:hypothetical protein